MIVINKKPTLGFVEALKLSLSRITQCSGRSRRSEYWWTALLAIIISLVTCWIPVLGPIIGILLAVAMIPLTIRRLHDCDHSAWWLGYGLILLGIGFFVLLLCAISVTPTWGDLVSERMIRKSKEEIVSNPFYKLLAVVMFFYFIIILAFMWQKGLMRENKYGESPKYEIYEEEGEDEY